MLTDLYYSNSTSKRNYADSLPTFWSFIYFPVLLKTIYRYSQNICKFLKYPCIQGSIESRRSEFIQHQDWLRFCSVHLTRENWRILSPILDPKFQYWSQAGAMESISNFPELHSIRDDRFLNFVSPLRKIRLAKSQQ